MEADHLSLEKNEMSLFFGASCWEGTLKTGLFFYAQSYECHGCPVATLFLVPSFRMCHYFYAIGDHPPCDPVDSEAVSAVVVLGAL